MDIQEKCLTINQFSRPARKIERVKGIVVHWVANPKTTAVQNRNFFEGLKNQNPKGNQKELRYALAHFIVGLEGEVIQCLLENEMGYHVGASKYSNRALKELSPYPNDCTLGIELCHINWEGGFTGETIRGAGKLILELCERYRLGRENIYRHFDITGKDCPRYFVQHEDRWLEFLDSLFSKS